MWQAPTNRTAFRCKNEADLNVANLTDLYDDDLAFASVMEAEIQTWLFEMKEYGNTSILCNAAKDVCHAIDDFAHYQPHHLEMMNTLSK